MYVLVRIELYIHPHIQTHIQCTIFLHMIIPKYDNMHTANMNASKQAHIHAQASMYIHICIYVYTHLHSQAYTHINIDIILWAYTCPHVYARIMVPHNLAMWQKVSNNGENWQKVSRQKAGWADGWEWGGAANYLANLALFPGRVELRFLPPNAQVTGRNWQKPAETRPGFCHYASQTRSCTGQYTHHPPSKLWLMIHWIH